MTLTNLRCVLIMIIFSIIMVNIIPYLHYNFDFRVSSVDMAGNELVISWPIKFVDID